MKLRHAAALATVGWYLMVPPFQGTPQSLSVNTSTAISGWDQVESYDSASDCENGMIAYQDNINKTKFAVESQGNATRLRAKLALCIATDDPRLAK